MTPPAASHGVPARALLSADPGAYTTRTPDGELILVLPVADASLLLNANQRLHWAEERRRTRYWRTLSATTARSAINRGSWAPLPAAAITCTLHWPYLRHRDPANWHPTAKAILDGLVDARLLPDDDDAHVQGPDMRAAHGSLTVRFTITPTEPTP